MNDGAKQRWELWRTDQRDRLTNERLQRLDCARQQRRRRRFEETVLPLIPDVRRLVRSHMPHHDADDVLQNTLLVALVKMDEGHNPPNPIAWLFTIAKFQRWAFIGRAASRKELPLYDVDLSGFRTEED